MLLLSQNGILLPIAGVISALCFNFEEGASGYVVKMMLHFAASVVITGAARIIPVISCVCSAGLQPTESFVTCILLSFFRGCRLSVSRGIVNSSTLLQ